MKSAELCVSLSENLRELLYSFPGQSGREMLSGGIHEKIPADAECLYQGFGGEQKGYHPFIAGFY
jgi:hypothetical protein